MRYKVDWHSSSTVNYKDFCKKHPDITISSIEWRKIIYAYNYWLRDYILETGEKVRLPGGLGDISICKKKIKNLTRTDSEGKVHINLPVDWAKSRGTGKRIFNFNYHTEGYSFRWQWFKKTARISLSKAWSFKATRDSSRKLAQYLKTDDKYQHIYREWLTYNHELLL